MIKHKRLPMTFQTREKIKDTIYIALIITLTVVVTLIFLCPCR